MDDLALRAEAVGFAACEALYRAEGLGTVVRLSTARPEPGRPGVPGLHLLEGPPGAGWLAASAALAGLDAPAAALRARMLGGLAKPCAVAWVEEGGAVAARALAAVHAGLVEELSRDHHRDAPPA